MDREVREGIRPLPWWVIFAAAIILCYMRWQIGFPMWVCCVICYFVNRGEAYGAKAFGKAIIMSVTLIVTMVWVFYYVFYIV